MRFALVLAWGLLGACASATAQVSIEFGLPSVRIGVQVGGYPDLVAVPGYPVYYAPQLGSNLFFYDGLYWVYAQDQWYASSWYDGPWDLVAPESVPYFVLRVPVRYYRQPPAYFSGWGRDAPPHWGEHWGRDWDQRHGGWDRWDRASAPPPAPLPTYQRAYAGGRYPDASQQRSLRDSNYHYQPHEAVVRQQFARPVPPAAPAARGGRSDRTPPSVPPPAERRATAPEGTDHAAAQRPETRTPAAAPPPAARHGTAPERADRAAAARPETRAPAPAPAATAPPAARHGTADRAPAPRDAQAASPRPPAPASREPQRRPATEARSAPPPAAARPPENRGGEPREARAPQSPPQHQAPAPRAREPAAERPPAKAPEQKKEPERERDH